MGNEELQAKLARVERKIDVVYGLVVLGLVLAVGFMADRFERTMGNFGVLVVAGALMGVVLLNHRRYTKA